VRLAQEIITGMQQLAGEQRRLLGPRAPWHVGDIAWAFCVIEAPDGRFAAYALLWPDDENGVGELEPVGVREEFRRRGLGAAVCTYALRRWYDEGGRQSIVYCLTDDARALYESLGFRLHATMRAYSR
jgi:GNAT superfamily N-acetyltransferase